MDIEFYAHPSITTPAYRVCTLSPSGQVSSSGSWEAPRCLGHMGPAGRVYLHETDERPELCLGHVSPSGRLYLHPRSDGTQGISSSGEIVRGGEDTGECIGHVSASGSVYLDPEREDPCFFCLRPGSTCSPQLAGAAALLYALRSKSTKDGEGPLLKTAAPADVRDGMGIYSCPECGVSLRAPAGERQYRLTCPKCGAQFLTPAPEGGISSPGSSDSGFKFARDVMALMDTYFKAPSRDEQDSAADRLEEIFPMVLLHHEAFAGKESSVCGVDGMCAYVLADYRANRYYNLEKLKKYAETGAAFLTEYTDRCGPAFDETTRKTVKSALEQLRELLAYAALDEERFEDVPGYMLKNPVTITSLGMTGTALSCLADMRNDPQMARTALGILEKFDSAVTSPAVPGSYAEDVYRRAYTFYALMLSTNATRYPGAGFSPDNVGAVRVLQKALTVVSDEQFVEWLTEDLNKYRARL